MTDPFRWPGSAPEEKPTEVTQHNGSSASPVVGAPFRVVVPETDTNTEKAEETGSKDAGSIERLSAPEPEAETRLEPAPESSEETPFVNTMAVVEQRVSTPPLVSSAQSAPAVRLEVSARDAETILARATVLYGLAVRRSLLLEMNLSRADLATLRVITPGDATRAEEPHVLLEHMETGNAGSTQMRAVLGDASAVPDVILEASPQNDEALKFRFTGGASNPPVTMDVAARKGQSMTVRARIGRAEESATGECIQVEASRNRVPAAEDDPLPRWRNRLTLRLVSPS